MQKKSIVQKNYTILDYVTWRGDVSFNESPLNEVDTLIFSQLSYIKYKGFIGNEFDKKSQYTFKDAYDYFEKVGAYTALSRSDVDSVSEKIDGNPLDSIEIGELLKRVAHSKRYADILLYGHVDILDDENEKQFSAIFLKINPKEGCVVYRGTDETLIGWKEDFNMAYMSPVPAQTDAVVYLENCAKFFKGKLHILGHSKGGNLAVYASAFCDKKIKDRIVSIENFDGPGFQKNILDTRDFDSVSSRIKTYVPQHSIIGMLLGHEEEVIVIKSEKKGFSQHNPFHWCIQVNNFVWEDLSLSSKKIDKSIKFWLEDVTLGKRALFINTLFSMMESADIEHIADFSENKAKLALSAIKTLTTLDKEERNQLVDTIQSLFKSFIDLYEEEEKLL